MDISASHDHAPTVTLTDGNGRTFDVTAQAADDLLMLAALTRRTPCDVFSDAIESARSSALAKPRNVDPTAPRAPRTPKAKG